MKKLFEKAVAVIALIALAVTAFPFTAPIKAETSRTELVIEPNAAVLSSDAHWEAEPVRENAVVPVRDAIWMEALPTAFPVVSELKTIRISYQPVLSLHTSLSRSTMVRSMTELSFV